MISIMIQETYHMDAPKGRRWLFKANVIGNV